MNILFVSLRGVGDSIILRNFLRHYEEKINQHNISVLTWDSNKYVFSSLESDCEVTYLLSVSSSGFIKYAALIASIFLRVKLKSFDLCINLSGDLKENIVSCLVRSSSRIAPFWSRNHPYNNIITTPLCGHRGDIYIEESRVNVYHVHEYIFNIVFDNERRLMSSLSCEVVKIRTTSKSIGLFPFASQECREWGLKKWDLLGVELINRGYNVYYICSDNTRDEIESMKSISMGGIIYNGDHASLFDLSEYIECSICHDTFSSHLSYMLGLAVYIISGASDPVLFKTPGSTVISSSGSCEYYPCYNRPKCIGSSNQYVCIRSITLTSVLNALFGDHDDHHKK